MLHEKMKQVREENGLNQADFAKSIGVSPATYNGYEQGKQSPKAETIKLLCKQFNVSADWLLGIESKTSIDTWADIAKIIDEISFGYNFVFNGYFTDKKGNDIKDSFTLVALPTTIIFQHFRELQQLEMLAFDNNSSSIVDTWKQGAYNSKLNSKIDFDAWNKLLEYISDFRFNIIVEYKTSSEDLFFVRLNEMKNEINEHNSENE